MQQLLLEQQPEDSQNRLATRYSPALMWPKSRNFANELQVLRNRSAWSQQCGVERIINQKLRSVRLACNEQRLVVSQPQGTSQPHKCQGVACPAFHARMCMSTAQSRCGTPRFKVMTTRMISGEATRIHCFPLTIRHQCISWKPWQGLRTFCVYKHLPSGFSNRPLRSTLPLGAARWSLNHLKPKCLQR